VPTVEDGIEEMKFMKAVLDSSRNGSAWTEIPASS